METVLAGPTTDVVLGELDFPSCYERELSSLIWFVMSLGADAHRAADVAQSTFAEAFPSGTAFSIPMPGSAEWPAGSITGQWYRRKPRSMCCRTGKDRCPPRPKWNCTTRHGPCWLHLPTCRLNNAR